MKAGTRLSSVIFPGLILVVAFLLLASFPSILGMKKKYKPGFVCSNVVCAGTEGIKCCPGYLCITPKTRGSRGGRCIKGRLPSYDCVHGLNAECGGDRENRILCCPPYWCDTLGSPFTHASGICSLPELVVEAD